MTPATIKERVINFIALCGWNVSDDALKTDGMAFNKAE